MSSPVSGRRRSRETDHAPPAPPDSIVFVDGFRFRRVASPLEVEADGRTHTIATIRYEEVSFREHCQRMIQLMRADRNEALRRQRRERRRNGRRCKRARLAASDEAILGLPEARAGDSEAAEDCAVCLQDFGAEEDTLRAMPCSHAFHQDCIFSWLRVNHVCPLCRHALPTHKDKDGDGGEDEDEEDSSEEDDDEQDGGDGSHQPESVPEPDDAV